MDLIRLKESGDTVTAMLCGEIDHCSAETMKRSIEQAIGRAGVRHLRLDLTDVSFMDSSGIGMMIGRYKTMASKKGTVTAVGMMPQLERIFRMAGLHRIIRIESLEKEENI